MTPPRAARRTWRAVPRWPNAPVYIYAVTSRELWQERGLVSPFTIADEMTAALSLFDHRPTAVRFSRNREVCPWRDAKVVRVEIRAVRPVRKPRAGKRGGR